MTIDLTVYELLFGLLSCTMLGATLGHILTRSSSKGLEDNAEYLARREVGDFYMTRPEEMSKVSERDRNWLIEQRRATNLYEIRREKESGKHGASTRTS